MLGRHQRPYGGLSYVLNEALLEAEWAVESLKSTEVFICEKFKITFLELIFVLRIEKNPSGVDEQFVWLIEKFSGEEE